MPRTRSKSAPPPALDLERLRAACGRRRVDLASSLYGPDSITWRINREAVLLLGGGRALLMQVAHPLVAAGVAAHSDFRRNPLQRLMRTLDLTLTISFGDAAHAIQAVRAIEQMHKRVHGKLDATVGPFPRGTPYNANDPALLFWVHATLVDAALAVYERFVEPLSAATHAQYYEESKISARLFSVPARLIPPTFAAFRRYMDDMIGGSTLAVGPSSKAIAASILRPPLPLGVQQVFQTANFFTVGLLPPAIRERYAFRWGSLREGAMDTVAAASRQFLPWLPQMLRAWPHAKERTDDRL